MWAQTDGQAELLYQYRASVWRAIKIVASKLNVSVFWLVQWRIAAIVIVKQMLIVSFEDDVMCILNEICLTVCSDGSRPTHKDDMCAKCDTSRCDRLSRSTGDVKLQWKPSQMVVCRVTISHKKAFCVARYLACREGNQIRHNWQLLLGHQRCSGELRWRNVYVRHQWKQPAASC